VKIDPEVPRIWDIDPTEAISRTLQNAIWKEIEPGLWDLSVVQSDYDVGLWAWRFDLSRFAFKVVEQDNEVGNDVHWLRAQQGAVLAFNAGRFEKDSLGRLSASGLIVIAGALRSQPWPQQRGGVLAISSSGRLSILPSKAYPFSDLKAQYAIQATPIMIEPGGKWVMQTNDHDMQHRTAICLYPDNSAMVIIIDRVGLSLYELASILRPGNPGHVFNCDSAIALDGGPSTQAYFRPQNVEIRGGWNIHDAIIVERK
jgi:exopolysaccharide biosynthesis protein